MRHVFLSYCHDDTDFVQVLKSQLGQAGFSTWKDLDLEAGDTWHAEIENAIRGALALIVVLSEKAQGSAYVNFEWAYAMGAGIPVLPLLLKVRPDSVHPRLKNLQALDFTNYVQRPWDALLRVLRTLNEAERPFTIVVPADAPAFVKKAAQGLDSLDPRERIAAVETLAEMNDPAALDILAEAVHHPAPDVRDRAALPLVKRKDLRSLPAIFDAFQNQRWDLIDVSTLRQLGERAIPALLAVLRDSTQSMRVRRGIAYGLDAMLTDEAVDALHELLGSPECDLRKAAVKSLTGHPRALPWILDACGDNDLEVAGTALEALRKYSGPDVVAMFVKMLSHPKLSFRQNAVQGLAEVVDASAGPALLAALQDDDNFLRHYAAKALTKLADASLVPELLRSLETEPKQETVDVLVEMKGEAVVAGMRALLQSGKPRLRRIAASALGKLSDSSAVPDLVLALQDEEEGVRERAAYALGNLQAAAAVPDLIAILRREDEFDEVHEAAASALGQIGTRETRIALRDWKARAK